MLMKTAKKNQLQNSLLIQKSGACSQSLFYIFNQEFDNEMDIEERAAASLTGGVTYRSKVCGLIIGAVLGAGAEAYKRYRQPNSKAIEIAKTMVDSFSTQFSLINCNDIVEIDLSKESDASAYYSCSMAEKCFEKANKWSAEAFKICKAAFNNPATLIYNETPCNCCASRIIMEMGGTDDEAALVAGLSGGIGLSGNICGAYTAALWYKALTWLRENPDKPLYPFELNLQFNCDFLEITYNEILCPNLCGKTFRTTEEHSNFIEEGGCNKLIDLISKL